MNTVLKALGLSILALAVQIVLNMALTQFLVGFVEGASRTMVEVLPLFALAIDIVVFFGVVEVNRRAYAKFVELGTARSVIFTGGTVLAVMFAVFWALYSFMLFN